MAVVAVARAVVRDAGGGLRHAVLRQHRRSVGVMMLHRHDPLEPELRRDAGGQVAGVEVARHDLGRDAEQPLVGVEREPEVFEGFQVFEIADVLAHVAAAAVDQREGVLEVRPHRDERLRALERQVHRERGIAAGPAQEDGRVSRQPDHRVVVARHDLPIVQQERVGDRAEPPSRVGVVGGDRLLAQIAARHHQRTASAVEQQVMQRRVRKHHADGVEAGRDGRSERAVPAAREQYDRPLGRCKQLGFRGAQLGDRTRLTEGAHHHGERLRVAVLAGAETLHGDLVGCVHGEVEAAQPADGDDLSRREQLRRRADGIGPRTDPGRKPGASGALKPHSRAALRTGIGLRVIAAVARRAVLV